MYGQTEYGQIEDEENDLWPAERELLCPNCGVLTTVLTPVNFIFIRLDRCSHCGLDFIIENNVPRAMATARKGNPETRRGFVP